MCHLLPRNVDHGRGLGLGRPAAACGGKGAGQGGEGAGGCGRGGRRGREGNDDTKNGKGVRRAHGAGEDEPKEKSEVDALWEFGHHTGRDATVELEEGKEESFGGRLGGRMREFERGEGQSSQMKKAGLEMEHRLRGSGEVVESAAEEGNNDSGAGLRVELSRTYLVRRAA